MKYDRVLADLGLLEGGGDELPTATRDRLFNVFHGFFRCRGIPWDLWVAMSDQTRHIAIAAAECVAHENAALQGMANGSVGAAARVLAPVDDGELAAEMLVNEMADELTANRKTRSIDPETVVEIEVGDPFFGGVPR